MSNIPNIDEVHVTGTGLQKQFITFLSEITQYKDVVSSESTSSKMSDEQLVTFIDEYYS